MKELKNIYDVFEELEKRKAMFLGNDYTFHSLDSFISGYMLAANESKLTKEGIPNFGYFNTWILGHIHENFGLSGGWFWQISNRNPNDDKKSFDDFFALLRIFKSSIISTKSIMVNTQAQNFSIDGPIKRFNGSNLNEPIKAPYAIHVVSITNSTTVWINYLDEDNNVLNNSWYLNTTEASQYLEQEFGGYLKGF